MGAEWVSERPMRRWLVVVAGVVMQAMLGVVMAWSVFRDPLAEAFGWTVSEITLAFQERPYRPADLFTAGLDNPEELFVSAEEPLGIQLVNPAGALVDPNAQGLQQAIYFEASDQ